jgi:hypothetical protein
MRELTHRLRSVLSLLSPPYGFLTAPEQSARARLQQARPSCAVHSASR